MVKLAKRHFLYVYNYQKCQLKVFYKQICVHSNVCKNNNIKCFHISQTDGNLHFSFQPVAPVSVAVVPILTLTAH